MKKQLTTTLAIVLGMLACLAAGALAEEVSIVREASDYVVPAKAKAAGERDTYTGTLRVYLIEPAGRWPDAQGDPYENGFLKFMEVTDINLEDGERYYNESMSPTGGSDLDNLAAIAVLYNSQGYQQDAYPPNGYYFTAYYSDLAVYAEPDAIGLPPATTPDYSHAVFIEEGTATW